MEKKLEASAKPFIPQTNASEKRSEIRASAPAFVPNIVPSYPTSYPPQFFGSGNMMSDMTNKQNDEKKKKGGRKGQGKEYVKETFNQRPVQRNKDPKQTTSKLDGKKSTGGKQSSPSHEDELRKLTSLLQEKEERLKEIEALRVKESIAHSATLENKVKEEVTQKLKQASVLSTMYKSSLNSPETPSSSSRTGVARNTKKSDAHSKSIIVSGSNSRRKADADKTPRSGGLLRVDTQKNAHIEERGVKKSKSEKSPLHKGNRGSGTKGRTQSRAPVYEMSPEERIESEHSRAIMERAANERRMKRIEDEIQNILNNIRKSKSYLQDFCLLGIRNGAPSEFIEKCSALEEYYTNILLKDFYLGDGYGSIELAGTARKLCELWTKQLNLIRQVIEKAEKKGGIDDNSLRQVRNVFANEIESFVGRLQRILDSLDQILCKEYISPKADTAIMGNTTCNSNFENQLRSALQVLLLNVAEMVRMNLRYADTDHGSGHDYLRELKVKKVETYRKRALSIAPHDGAAFEALSKIALRPTSVDTHFGLLGNGKKRKDVFLSAYFLARGMGAELPLTGARELLLDIFENQKAKSDEAENVTALSRLTLAEHLEWFKVHFLASAGVAYSRTGADRIGYHLTKTKRHMGTMLQLLSSLQLSEQNRGSRGNFAAFEPKEFPTQSQQGNTYVGFISDPVLLNTCRDVDKALCQALVITLSLVESVGKTHDIHRVYSDSKWSAAYSNWVDEKIEGELWTLEDHIAHIEPEERVVIERRYALQRIHKVQSIPGLVDLLRLMVGLLTCLFPHDNIGKIEEKGGTVTIHLKYMMISFVLHSGAAYPIGTPNYLATTRMIALFFEWLEAHAVYHAPLTVLDLGGNGWENVEAQLPQYLSSLRPLENERNASAKVDSTSETLEDILADDVDLRGFVPLRTSVAGAAVGLRKIEESAMMKVDKESAHPAYDTWEDYVNSELLSFDQNATTWLQHYATRCNRSVRNLCKREVYLGELRFHQSSTNNKREAILPSHDEGALPLTAIAYNSTIASQQVVYQNMLGKNDIGSDTVKYMLTQEGFMGGVVSSLPVDGIDKDNCRNDVELSDALGGSFAGHDLLNDGALSSLSDVDEDDTAVNENTNCKTKDLTADFDDDLDLNNLVLEDLDDVGPPPGFSKLDSHEQSDVPADDDFAALCASLLTVPLTEAVPEPSGLEKVTAEKEKRGLLRVNLPSKDDKGDNMNDNDCLFSRKPSNYGMKKLYTPNSVPSNVRLKSSEEIPLIVIDAPNVAMRHGLNAKFSCKGIQLALNFFLTAGHKVIAFLPDYYLNFDRVGELRRLASLNIGEVRAAQLPDDVEILQQLVLQGIIIGTPSQDYDDSYCINYAQKRGGYIISNDMYRDHIQRIEDKPQRDKARKWIKSHVVSFTFVGDEFLPNPDASIFTG